jgi:hypothetical protein
MGFALWIDKDVAWAQGTHEYRPMGTAVVSATDLFRPRDFSPRRSPRPRTDDAFAGLFASLGDVNGFLRKRRSQVIARKSKKVANRQLAVV